MGYRWPQMQGSGGAQVAQQIGNIGAQVGRLGEAFAEKQARVRLDDYKLQYQERMIKLGNDIAAEQDEDKYESMAASAFSDMQKKTPKGMAGPFATSYAKSEQARQMESINQSKQLRVRDKWVGTNIVSLDKAMDSGNAILYKDSLDTGLALGYIDEGQYEASLKKGVHDITKRGLENRVLGTNPEVFLRDYTTAEQLIDEYPSLTPGDFQDLRNNAISQVRANKTMRLQALSKQRGQLSTMAQTLSVTPSAAFTEIKKMGLSDVEENALFEEFSDARKNILNGLGDPYTKTQNYARLVRMRDAARLGKLTEEDISDAEGKTDGISLVHAEDLRKRIADGGSGKDFRDGAAAKTFKNMLKIEDSFDVGGIEEEQGLRWFEQWSIDNPNATQREADEQAIRVYERVEREDKIPGGLPVTANDLRDFRLRAEAKTNRDIMQSVWDEMTKEERVMAMQALKQGKTPQEIIAFFEANK